jgi:hypothetical protein
VVEYVVDSEYMYRVSDLLEIMAAIGVGGAGGNSCWWRMYGGPGEGGSLG